jgi:tetratricopeptide (TPR) repeat protein
MRRLTDETLLQSTK